MARRSLMDIVNKNQRGYFDNRLDKKPIGGMTRQTDPGGDTGIPEIPSVDYGQAQAGPEWQSALGSRIDYWGSAMPAYGGQSTFEYYGDLLGMDITNMGEFHDWWNAGGNEFFQFGGGQYDNFYDWLSNYNQNTGYTPTEAPPGSTGPGWYSAAGPGSQVGGGPGGAGDLGTGNVFTGGGMGSSMFGEGLQEQGTDTSMLDEPDSACASLYAQSGGFDMTQLSYTEFESMYC